jgi:type VI secretion system protein ImpF
MSEFPLYPSLLDRLLDDAPSESARVAKGMSHAQLRACVMRDLTHLFNTINLSGVADLREHPEASRSVVNYGLPDLGGRTLSSIDSSKLELLLRQAIWDFEPRLVRDTVQVRAAPERVGAPYNRLRFGIDALLWAEPLPMPLYLRTEIDLEDGEVRLYEQREPATRVNPEEA